MGRNDRHADVGAEDYVAQSVNQRAPHHVVGYRVRILRVVLVVAQEFVGVGVKAVVGSYVKGVVIAQRHCLYRHVLQFRHLGHPAARHVVFVEHLPRTCPKAPPLPVSQQHEDGRGLALVKRDGRGLAVGIGEQPLQRTSIDCAINAGDGVDVVKLVAQGFHRTARRIVLLQPVVAAEQNLLPPFLKRPHLLPQWLRLGVGAARDVVDVEAVGGA